jgi:hypothetical protein
MVADSTGRGGGAAFRAREFVTFVSMKLNIELTKIFTQRLYGNQNSELDLRFATSSDLKFQPLPVSIGLGLVVERNSIVAGAFCLSRSRGLCNLLPVSLRHLFSLRKHLLPPE